MKYRLSALATLGITLLASPAVAQDAPTALAQCAWSRTATTSATLVNRVRFDRQYVYDGEGSPTVGLIMRIRAACPSESAALRGGVSGRAHLRAFLRRLRATRPVSTLPDSFDEPVFRCETRFNDASAGSPPAAIGWGHGADRAQHQLSYVSTIEGHAATMSSEALDDPRALSRLLDQAQRADAEAVEVETLAEGRASGRPFRVRDGGGSRVCRFVHPDGSYTDA
jgi:hypothetical protein